MRKFSLVGLVCITLAAPCFAQEEGWYLVASSASGDDDYSIKLASGERSQNKQGEAITVVVGKDHDKKVEKVDVFKWYVTDGDCKQEYGSLVMLNLDGSFKFEVPFAKGSKNIGSAIAETICNVGDGITKKAAGKSI